MTDRFVKPPTLELIKLSDSGMLAAKTLPRHKPAIRAARPSHSYTMIRPAIDVSVLNIMSARRMEGTKVAVLEVKSRKTSCVAPTGIWMRRELSLEKPNPEMTMALNCIRSAFYLQEGDGGSGIHRESRLTLVSPPFAKLTEAVYRTRSHSCGSVKASITWLGTNLSLSRSPVLFSTVRLKAICCCFSSRKTALSGESGRNMNRTIGVRRGDTAEDQEQKTPVLKRRGCDLADGVGDTSTEDVCE